LGGDTSGVPASIAKYVCTELAVEATSKLAQLCGGNGLSDKLPLERLMRDMRMFTVAGGASEVLQATIAKNLGRLLKAAVPDEARWERLAAEPAAAAGLRHEALVPAEG
jgi:alkylation response protein AidB-like acyl-CoA dehydrogenase